MEVNGNQSEGRDGGQEWEGAESVVVISVNVPVVIRRELLVECHL